MSYKIIGEDDKEYGPVELEEIREWIKEGRADGITKICIDGGEDWKTASEFPELAKALDHSKPGEKSQPPPANLLPFAVFLNLCCCPPLGLAATIYAAFALAKYSSGDWVGSSEATAKAWQWCWYSLALGIPFQILLAYWQIKMGGFPLEGLQ